MCNSKKRFRDREEAKRSRQNIRSFDGTRMRIYECPACRGFHLTTVNYDGENYDGRKKRVSRKGRNW